MWDTAKYYGNQNCQFFWHILKYRFLHVNNNSHMLLKKIIIPGWLEWKALAWLAHTRTRTLPGTSSSPSTRIPLGRSATLSPGEGGPRRGASLSCSRWPLALGTDLQQCTQLLAWLWAGGSLCLPTDRDADWEVLVIAELPRQPTFKTPSNVKYNCIMGHQLRSVAHSGRLNGNDYEPSPFFKRKREDVISQCTADKEIWVNLMKTGHT